MVDVLGGPQAFLQYKMIETGTYEKLAQANGLAVSGMQPKITTWNTGSNAGEADSAAPIRNILQSLPPLLSTIHEQTGITPPSWVAQMPRSNSATNGVHGFQVVDSKTKAPVNAN
jgi:flotillin